MTKEPMINLSVGELKESIIRHLDYSLGADESRANTKAWWKAACLAVNEVVFEQL